MKNRKLKKWMTALILTAALVMPAGSSAYAAEESGDGNVINVGSVEEFMEIAENCKYDKWSVGKTINLTADIDLSKEKFRGIGYFNGTFEGNGHTVSVGSFMPKGSNYGFFRYIGESGTVNNLKISASVIASGSAENIGGVAGTNYGMIKNTVFRGKVSGKSGIGGIAGVNRVGASIENCTSEGVILATYYTGGITGKNEGSISGCVNGSSVNVEELESSLDLGGMDVSSLNLARKVVIRNDMGGIAGTSSGVIAGCRNQGTIGFNHTGYNVGGITGSQKGRILDSVNEGTLYGRKDVGGIVGQAMPYIESEYFEDKAKETQKDVEGLKQTMGQVSSALTQASTDTKNYISTLNDQYTALAEQISGNLNTLSDSVEQDNLKGQEYADNINQALKEIRDIQSQEGELSQEQMDEIKDKFAAISDNLKNLQGSYAGTESSAEDLVNNISGELEKTEIQKNLQGMMQSMDKNVQSAANGINSTMNQLSKIADTVGEELAAVLQKKERIEDISSMETAENTDGVIAGCTNRGSVHGDLNAGGIVGTMNIEYENDPEVDLELPEPVDIVLRSTVSNVVIRSMNYGSVNVKKNCAGGIVGLQEMGLVYACEGYGEVQSESGNYLGGIAGQSSSKIQKTYSLCNVSGEDYLGGICGSGYEVKDSVSICSLDSEGEYLGSIAGELKDAGEAKNNLYVGTTLYGVDGISYTGVAEARSYEEIMAMEGIPEGFHRVIVSFETKDGQKLGEKTTAYGGTLTEKDFPQTPEKEGCYVEWSGTEQLNDIRSNLTIYAEQVPWTESIQGNAVQKDGKGIFLVKGEFHKEAEIDMQETEKPSALPGNASAEYAYTWKILGEDEKNFDKLEGHFYIPDSEKNASLWIKQGKDWKKVKSSVDGSYLVAEIPYGAEFVLVSEPVSREGYILAGGIAAVTLLMVFLLKRGKKRRMS